jgi:Ion channel
MDCSLRAGQSPGPWLLQHQGASDLDAALSWKELLFFSFTTLTSTGYGEIVPNAGHAQSLAILERELIKLFPHAA